VDAVAELFQRYGQGVAIEEPIVSAPDGEWTRVDPERPVVVRTYLPVDDRVGERAERLEQGIWHLGRLRRVEPLRQRTLSEDDWAHAWKRHFFVHRVGQRIVIVPSWRRHRASPEDVIIRLDPGMAFGTGLHPTTRLCLQALERSLGPGANVLDLGTGSGILAIAAARLGARRVLALDIEPVAVGVAQENVRRNRVARRVHVSEGSLPLPTVAEQSPGSAQAVSEAGEPWGDAVASSADRARPSFRRSGPQPAAARPVSHMAGPFELIIANISRSVILALLDHIAAALAPGGTVILSGLLEDALAEVIEAAQREGLATIETMQEGDWIALVARRDGGNDRDRASLPGAWHAQHRFFVPALAHRGDTVHFGPEQARQMARVLRLSRGDAVVALDGSGTEWLVCLEAVERDRAAGRVLDQRPSAGEPRAHLTLYQALLAREKFELVLQKGTELGVSAFVPLITERGMVRERLAEQRLERWRSIIREAAEQSRRGRLPELHQAVTLAQALAAAPSDALGLFAWEGSRRPLSGALRDLAPGPTKLGLWIGPEGGFSAAEAAQAEAAGQVAVSLGPRILRTETAGVALAAIVLYACGDMEPEPGLAGLPSPRETSPSP
jgi:ribosomal protein L11 methyltransferase